MHWLLSLDHALFHFINSTLANPFFDWLMPVLSGSNVPWLPALVVAVTVKKAAGGDTLLWPRITAFGADAVTVAGAEVIVDANEVVAALSAKDYRLLGKRILTTGGENLGEVTDVEFDPASGAISTLIAASGEVGGERLVGVGSFAVVVHAAS